MITVKLDSQSLNASPMFNLMLSSKELFHSNFLAWYLELAIAHNGTQIELAVISWFKNLFGNSPNQNQFFNDPKFKVCLKNVEREKDHIDLQVFFEIENRDTNVKQQHLLIIENKFKSLPYDKQLDKYKTLIDDKYPEHVRHYAVLGIKCFQISAPEWYPYGYFELTSMKNYKTGNEYFDSIIADYCQVLEGKNNDGLCALGRINVEDKDNFNTISSQSSELEELRLRDVYNKLVFSQLKNLLDKKLKTKSINCETHFDFTNNQGLLEATLDFDNTKYSVGIQIQGGQYRQFIYGIYSDSDIDKWLAVKWFFQDENYLSKPQKRAGLFNRNNTIFFGSFGNFRYRYLDIVHTKPITCSGCLTCSIGSINDPASLNISKSENNDSCLYISDLLDCIVVDLEKAIVISKSLDLLIQEK